MLKDNQGKKLSIRVFAEKLGVNRGVIDNIEYNRTEAKDNVIKLISLTFNVREEWLRDGIEPIFNEDTEEFQILNELEKQGVKPNVLTLIETYINMDENSKKMFDLYLDNFIDKRNKNLNQNQNNEQLEKTKEELCATIIEDTDAFEHTIEIKLYDLPVSAGTGTYLFDDIGYEMVTVDTRLYRGVDFALRVSGDSMEPRFFHNDIIYIRSTQHVDNGKIGVFYYEGEAYLKKFCKQGNEIYLVSLNENYEPIHIQNDSFRVVGVVI